MSWICKKCETENPDWFENCEVCNSLRGVRMSYVEEFNETNDSEEETAWQKRAIRYEKEVVNCDYIDYIVAKYGYSLYGDIILYAPYLLYSADSGNQESQFKLGELMLNHWRNVNKANAFQWFSRSANQGNADAMERIAFCFEEGIGVKRDFLEAKKWYLRALYHGCEAARQGLKRININTCSHELDL